MKTPVEMLIDIASGMTDAAITLELIYKSTGNGCEIDSGISCVVRSLLSTNEKAQAYIEQLSDVAPQQEKGESNIADDVFNAVVAAEKLDQLAHIYTESYFTDKDSDSPGCLMSAVIYDYARKVKNELKEIESKLS
ncbi:hypothetical protein ACE60T_003451 [Salmonella enterica]